MSQKSGQVLEYGETTAAVVTCHPAAALRRRAGADADDGPRGALVADRELAARVARGDDDRDRAAL